MQKAPSKSKSASTSATARSRKSGRPTFDKSGRGLWEWQTATGVFEQQITDEQLAKLEDSQLTFLEDRTREEPSPVSYFEFRAQTKSTPAPTAEKKPIGTARGPITRLFARFSRKA